MDEPATCSSNAAASRHVALQASARVQENHTKPAVVLWLTFPESSSVATSARQEALRNLTAAGVLTIVPAGFASTSPGSLDSLDSCSVPVASNQLALTVSASDEQDAVASGVHHESLECWSRVHARDSCGSND
jgi:hypothetical protein